MDSIDEDSSAVRVCKTRIAHLNSFNNDSPTFEKKRLDRLMVEHCFRCGYYDSASLLAKKTGIEVHYAFLYSQAEKMVITFAF